MSASYRINLHNKSFGQKRFLLFQDLPKPTNTNSQKVFTNVYQRSKLCDSPKGSVKFDMTEKYFGIYGSSEQNQDGTVRVRTDDYADVKLGPNGSYLFLTAGGDDASPLWDTEKMKKEGDKSEAKGGFTIETDDKFSLGEQSSTYIGCGALDPDGSVIPILTWLPEPKTAYQIFPHACFYICTGESQRGMVVDRSSLGPILKVDFTGGTATTATFTMDDKNNYVADDETEEANKQGRLSYSITTWGNL